MKKEIGWAGAALATLVAGLLILACVNDAKAAPTITQVFNGGTGTSTVPTYGKVLVGNSGGGYDLVATTSLGISSGVTSVFGRTGAVTAQSADYTTSLVTEGSNLYYTLLRFAAALAGTTTDALAQGVTNKYWSQTLFDNALSATTSVKSIATLPSLALPYSQLTGTPTIASSTLLADSNTFSGTLNTFTNAPKLATLTGLIAGNLGTLYQIASSSLFGFTPASNATAVNTTWPLGGGGDLSASRTLTFGGLSTSTDAVVGNIPYFSGVNTFANVATTTASCSGSASCTAFTVIGSSPVTISVADGGRGWASTTIPNSNSIYSLQSANVGISTSSPYARLSVHSTAGGSTPLFMLASSTNGAATSTALTVLATGGLVISDGTATLPGFRFNSYGATTGFYASSATVTNYSSGGVPAFTIDGSNGVRLINNWGYQFSSSAASSITAADTGLYRLSAGVVAVGTGGGGSVAGTLIAQKIGVGTSTPWGRLSVNPDALGSGVPEFVVGSSTATHFVIDGAGNVGIGTTTPGTLLSLGNTGANTINISATATSTFGSGINIATGCFAVGGTCVGGSSSLTGTTGQIAYFSAANTAVGTSSLLIGTSGNVGISTTTPWAKLSINNSTNDTAAQPLFVIASSTATATTTQFIVTNSGQVGIGSTTPLVKLAVVGSGNGLNSQLATFSGSGNGTVKIMESGQLVITGDGSTATTLFSVSLGTTLLTTIGSNGVLSLGAAAGSGILNMGGGYLQVTTTATGNNGVLTTYNGLNVTLGALGGTAAPMTVSTNLATAKVVVVKGAAAQTGNLQEWQNSAGTALSVVAASGAHGIGTSTPYFGLTVASSTGAQLSLTDASATSNPWFFRSISGNLYIGTSSPSTYATSTVPALTLDTNGDVYLQKLGTAAGTFLAVNATGKIIATTTPSGGGSGTVTSVATDSTLTGGPITTTGTLALNLANANTWTALQTMGAGINVPSGVLGYSMEGKLLGYASSTNQSTIFGFGAGGNNATTSATTQRNAAFGHLSLNANTTGQQNTAIGYNSLLVNTTGSFNTSIGGISMFSNTTGYDNTAVGYESLLFNTTGYDNTAVGYFALLGNTTGATSTAIGRDAGRYIADGSTANQTSNSSLYLGAGTKALASGDANEIVIGYNAIGVGSNSAVLGNNSILKTILNGAVGVATTSPFAKFSVHANNGDTFGTLFAIASSTASATTTLFSIDNGGHIVTGGTVPTTGSCGSTSSVAGNDNAGSIMFTGTLVTSCVMNLAQAVPAGQTLGCTVSGDSLVGFAAVTATTTTSVTFGISSGLAAGTLYYHCNRWRN